MSQFRLAALVPCYGAGTTVASVVSSALAYVEKVLVVDDGSRDESSDRAREAGAQVITHTRNRGKGAALREGFQELSGQGFTHVVTLDADGQHLASQIPVLVAQSERYPERIIIGSRCRDGVHEIDPLKRWANDFADGWVERASGKKILDTQSGFRIYPMASLANILSKEIRGRHFEFESEVLILAVRRGLCIETVDVQVYYPPPDERHSHYHPWLDTLRIILMIIPFVSKVRR
ncbi:MAG: glycosyltransferase family 2 protein [Candidatus Binatia bacterium]|nr:glycosyltransferase family 2 protein [Candidatus Binatia bacterium]